MGNLCLSGGGDGTHLVYHESKDSGSSLQASLSTQETSTSSCLFQVRNLSGPDGELEKDLYVRAIDIFLDVGFLNGCLWLVGSTILFKEANVNALYLSTCHGFLKLLLSCL